MSKVQCDPEILYVQKLYFFLFLITITTLASAITTWIFNITYALMIFVSGLGISYIAMLKKNSFIPPDKKITAQRMARDISQDTSPLSIARFASQLYYYFHEPAQAITLLEKFLSSHDPLLYSTLGEILLKEGKAKRALYVLRDNPYALVDPLLLSTQGRILKQINRIPEAAKVFERSLNLAKQNGFPHSGAHWFTHIMLTISYKANIHHTLADCYVILADFPQAKRHYRAGNRLLLDFTLWRHLPPIPIRSAKNLKNSY